MINEIKNEAEKRMQKTIASLNQDLTKLRTGRAHPSLIEHVKVPYYGSDMPLSQVLIPGEGWHEVEVEIKGNPIGMRAVTVDGEGNLLIAHKKAVWALKKGGPEQVAKCGSGLVTAICRSPEGTLYTIEYHERSPWFTLYRLAPAEEAKKIVDGAMDVAISQNGDIYYPAEDPSIMQFGHSPNVKRSLYRVGRVKPVVRDIGSAAGLAFWRDGGTLVVGDSDGDKLNTYRVGKDGSLDAKEGYYTLRTRGREPSRVSALTLDTEGRLYAATSEGVQVFDPTGRMCGVINAPARAAVTALAFAGPARDQMYVVCDDKLYARKTKVKGFIPAAKKAK